MTTEQVVYDLQASQETGGEKNSERPGCGGELGEGLTPSGEGNV